MEKKEIFNEMVSILKNYTKDVRLLEQATMDTHILNDLKINSVLLVDVIIKCEDVFGIRFDDEVDEIRTIGNAVFLIEKKLR